MAPGAYTSIILNHHPGALVSGITLPVESGGHRVGIPHGLDDPRVKVLFEDLTMFVSEMVDDHFQIPSTHPDAGKFIKQSPYTNETFDIVLCDGQVLRTHDRAAFREKREHWRLHSMELVFGMTRIKTGGTFVMLFHKADAWDTITQLRAFRSFSDVKILKPRCAHRNRSTFYLIAKNVQPDKEAAKAFIAEWKAAWIQATFGGEEGTGADLVAPTEAEVDALLQDFGPTLIEMARASWSIQIQALRSEPWITGNVHSVHRPMFQSPGKIQWNDPSAPRGPSDFSTMRSPVSDLPSWRLPAANVMGNPESQFGSRKETRALEAAQWRIPATAKEAESQESSPYAVKKENRAFESAQWRKPAAVGEAAYPESALGAKKESRPFEKAQWRSSAGTETPSVMSPSESGKEMKPRYGPQGPPDEDKAKKMASRWR
ncbi:MAG: hypothetical protein Q9202_007458 [Teloschistes flavicans]